MSVALLYYPPAVVLIGTFPPELQALGNFHPCILHRRTNHEDETVNKHFIIFFPNERKYFDNIITCMLLLDGDFRKHV